MQRVELVFLAVDSGLRLLCAIAVRVRSGSTDRMSIKQRAFLGWRRSIARRESILTTCFEDKRRPQMGLRSTSRRPLRAGDWMKRSHRKHLHRMHPHDMRGVRKNRFASGERGLRRAETWSHEGEQVPANDLLGNSNVVRSFPCRADEQRPPGFLRVIMVAFARSGCCCQRGRRLPIRSRPNSWSRLFTRLRHPLPVPCIAREERAERVSGSGVLSSIPVFGRDAIGYGVSRGDSDFRRCR
jgi:hypothetical protein